MRIRNITLAGMILLVLAFTTGTGVADSQTTATASDTVNQINLTDNEEIEPHEGLIGPRNPLYGFMMALDRLNEGFTFNKSEKIKKQMDHAKMRLSEAMDRFEKNDTDAAEIALEQYKIKVEEVNKSVSESNDVDSGLANALKNIGKHQKVIERLRASHPGNKGLERAYSNSLELNRKFAQKIQQKEARKDDEQEREVLQETVKIQAKITGNDTHVEVGLKFRSNSTDNFTIAQEIYDRLQFSKENITGMLKIEEESEGELKESMEAKAEVKMNASMVEIDYQFPLSNATNRTEIIDGVYSKLSKLTAEDILKVLKIEVKEDRKQVKEMEKEVKRENKEERKNNRADNKENND